MVEFITLFLGALTTGPRDVQMQVHQEVAAVELRLDGQVVASLRGEPWESKVDFGQELAPHLLEAVAYDDDTSEIGRTRQWINLTPKNTELTIVLDRQPSTRQVEARLSWQTLADYNEPIAARAVFDNQPIEVVDPRIIRLPPHDLYEMHHLRVELEFPGGLLAAAETTFGGQFGESVSSGLTAFPVILEGLRRLPALAEIEDWFLPADGELRVHSAEEGPVEIVGVMAPAASRLLYQRREWRESRPKFPLLSKEHHLRFVGVRPQVVRRAGGAFVVFPRSSEAEDRTGGLLQTLALVSFPNDHSPDVRLADAVAVAGLFANQSARRRVVLLITTSEETDGSEFSPEQVRRYLQRIGVPLVVWNPAPGARSAGRWGDSLNISTQSLLDSAYRALSKALDRQRIIWLDGLHLPQSIVLDPAIEAVKPLR
jgi:hypothetical protein